MCAFTQTRTAKGKRIASHTKELALWICGTQSARAMQDPAV